MLLCMPKIRNFPFRVLNSPVLVWVPCFSCHSYDPVSPCPITYLKVLVSNVSDSKLARDKTHCSKCSVPFFPLEFWLTRIGINRSFFKERNMIRMYCLSRVCEYWKKKNKTWPIWWELALRRWRGQRWWSRCETQVRAWGRRNTEPLLSKAGGCGACLDHLILYS